MNAWGTIMAIIPCKECAQQSSDRAASCPNCGAPAPHAVTRLRRPRVMSRVLITLMALWTLGTLLWLFLPSGVPDQLLAHARSSLQRLGRDSRPISNVNPIQPPLGTDTASTEPVVEQPQLRLSLPNPPQPVSPRAVYRATAEELSRDYDANVVATQARIGTSRVRLSGKVAEIDQDRAERPVVKLRTGGNGSVALTLAEEQREAAAQLVKGDTVEIECDRIGRNGALLEGSDCLLALVDSRPKEVNLALFLANENGPTRVYVVGPMSEGVCAGRSAEISSRLQTNQRGEHVVLRNCTDAARDSIPPEGCRLYSSSVSIAAVPSAHLWRYDCNPTALARTVHRKRTRTYSPANETTALAVAQAPVSMESDEDESGGRPVALPPMTTSPVPVPAEHAMTNNIRLALAANSDTGPAETSRVPAEESTVAHAMPSGPKVSSTPAVNPASTASMGTATAPDDLARVRAVDPRAADHISTYCAQTPASADREVSMADCRRREAEAWTRLVLQNEFPTLDEATRSKCSAPPFPDTYVAKESCVRYVLHLN